jgi:hypothetical protein
MDTQCIFYEVGIEFVNIIQKNVWVDRFRKYVLLIFSVLCLGAK